MVMKALYVFIKKEYLPNDCGKTGELLRNKDI
jgi:hypothetical protein